MSYDIDLISSQQDVINQLYNMNISISDSIPEIQAEYNLMVDKMVREKVSSNQVVIAKTKYLLRNVFYDLLTRFSLVQRTLKTQRMTLVLILRLLVCT